MRKTLYLLIIALLFMVAQNPDLAFGLTWIEDNPTTYGGGQLMRPSGFWVYKNGGMIGVDDVARGSYMAYANNRPIYRKSIVAPDIDKLLNTLKIVLTVGGETDEKEITAAIWSTAGSRDFTLKSFYGYKVDGTTGATLNDSTLEKVLDTLFAGDNLTDAQIAELASSAREQIAQGLSVYAGGLNPELYSFTEAFYKYDKGFLTEVKSTAVDQNGDVMYDDLNGDNTQNPGEKTLWTTDYFAGGSLVKRDTYSYDYKWSTNGDPFKVGGKYVLDKKTFNTIQENYYYEKGVQKGSFTTNSTQWTVAGKKEINGIATDYSFTVAANTILQRNIFDKMGRIEKEEGILGVNDSQSGLAIGTTTEHVYGEGGREIKTNRYFGTETVNISWSAAGQTWTIAQPKVMEVTENTYNTTGQLASSKTTLLENPVYDSVKTVVYQKATETANTTYQYNSLGQVYFADTVNKTDGTNERTYYVYNRQFIKFGNTRATWREPNLR